MTLLERVHVPCDTSLRLSNLQAAPSAALPGTAFRGLNKAILAQRGSLLQLNSVSEYDSETCDWQRMHVIAIQQ